MTVTIEAPADPRKELRISSCYFDALHNNPAHIIERAKVNLANVDFDTFVATGLSGTLAASLLGHALGKQYLILRKPDDLSTHGTERAEGALGKRWVFLDDFMSSGATHKRIHQQLADLIQDNLLHDAWDDETGTYSPCAPFETEYVGAYLYNRGDWQADHSTRTGAFWTPDYIREQGYWSSRAVAS